LNIKKSRAKGMALAFSLFLCFATFKIDVFSVSAFQNSPNSTAQSNAVTENSSILLSVNDARVNLNGKAVSFANGTTFVPLREVAVALGVPNTQGNILWDNASKSVTITKSPITISLQLNNQTAYANGVSETLPQAPFIKNGVIYIPLKYFSEKLGFVSSWSPSTNTIRIRSNASAPSQTQNQNANGAVAGVNTGVGLSGSNPQNNGGVDSQNARSGGQNSASSLSAPNVPNPSTATQTQDKVSSNTPSAERKIGSDGLDSLLADPNVQNFLANEILDAFIGSSGMGNTKTSQGDRYSHFEGTYPTTSGSYTSSGYLKYAGRYYYYYGGSQYELDFYKKLMGGSWGLASDGVTLYYNNVLYKLAY
jgi:archaellum component FlaF (FlaF/FlaG flagellin family)